jgi:hypothetical protein
MNETKKETAFIKMPEYFFDYGLQVFTHTEYDILEYILRNTIGWHKMECEASIKTMALMRHYSEKNIIMSINNLIAKTNIFNKIVYREKGSCIKKTKYIITENSVKLLNDYIKNNMSADFEAKKEQIKNRSIEAETRLKECREILLKKQQTLSTKTKNTENVRSNNEYRKSDYLLECWQEIINNFENDEYTTFAEYKDSQYNYYFENGYFESLPVEKYDDKIDIRLSDLMRFTSDLKTIDFYTTLIENKKTIGGQSKYLYNTLKINFGFKAKNMDRINIIYE